MLKKIAGICIGIIFLIIFFRIADFQWEDVWNKIQEGGLQSLLGVTFFTILVYLLSAIKWSIIIQDLNPDIALVSIRSLFGHISLSHLFGLVIPKLVGDIVVRSVALKNANNISMRSGAYTILIDQITNFFVAGIFLLPGILYFTKLISRDHGIVISYLMGIILIISFLVSNRLIFTLFGKGYIFAFSMMDRLPWLKKQSVQSAPKMDFVLTSRAGLKCILLSLIRNIVIAVRLYFIIWSMNLQIDFFPLFWCSSMMLLIGLVLLVPGQFGVGEMGWYAILRLSGAPDADIVIFLVSSRIFSNLGIILVGVFTWINAKLCAVATKNG